MKNFSILTNGILKENPLLVLSIGLCSSLAVTQSMFNGLGMGLAMTFVLLMSEIIISIFRKCIPDAIRLPIFIIVIAAFTTIVQLLLKAYVPALSDSLGVFLPLIVVNCIIMGRVESFASKNNPFVSILDAIGMGIGYTWVLLAISFVREFVGTGKFFGMQVFPEANAIAFFSAAPGGFFVFGLIVAITEAIQNAAKKEDK
ncbi:MAG: electron transport complex subunit RsxE [Treponema sp.]|uniref:electron transport complex subunit RsxE n=1 Tax=Treponema sp. TaxID=166 RepID=UPI001D1C1291|nr:electron transport complex subunit RsxE [Treponema sp.]MBS7310241.1 electron transport complex subunit RsxE [Treponema sp.]MCI5696159.1 electron transport complex subunit RsxE [Spirochaetia bacterium]MDD5810638.1 electron transport complex subunit RsxE [Treponema sp.]MDY5885949.1 electron transport complex subunit RsxE [Treponema sp.]